MIRKLFLRSYLLKICDINIKQFYRQLSVICPKTHRISEFESLITSSKNRAKNYILIEDNCNVLEKLNSKNMSLLLETKVKEVFKWRFNTKCCALIQVKDNNYLLKKEIRRHFGFETKKSFMNEMRFISLDSCPKVLSDFLKRDKNNNNNKNGSITDLTSRKMDLRYLNINYMRRKCKSNEEILGYLLSDKKVSDLDLNIRFYIINQLETYICRSQFKNFQILPFGSSIAGLGTPNSDLDLVLFPKQINEYSIDKIEDRKRLKNNLSHIADILETSLPFYSHFSRILTARIPIIKFGFNLAPIDIDLSLEMDSNSKHHGFYMSSFINYCIQLNPEVRDLILLLRIWAKQKNILKPKNWSTHLIYNGFTSFQLTSLVIYFLQREGLVPPMNYFLNSNQIFQKSDKQMNRIEMLAHFFEFVLTLPFQWEGISILNANTFPNPDSSPIYMENPFDIDLNMCRNITRANFDRFLKITSNCLEIMQNKGFSLVEIFENHNKTDIYKLDPNNSIKVDDLFVN